MKKIIGILSLFAVLAICACNQNSESNAAQDTPTAVETPATDADSETDVKYVEHECSNKCTPEGCHHSHGEKGHVCAESCHSDTEKAHDHTGHENHEGHGH